MSDSMTCSSIRGQVSREKKPTIEGKHEVGKIWFIVLLGYLYCSEYLALLISFPYRNNERKNKFRV